MKDNMVYVRHILDAISKAEKYTAGMDLQAFMQNEMVQSAVLMQLIVIGETTKKIPEQEKQKIDLPWKEIAGFRNRAVHNYFEIDLDVVWDTLTTDLPPLKIALSKL